MKDWYSKCGFNCGRCPAYKENARTKEARQRGSDGWKKYYGFKIRIDRMYCDGCPTPDEKKPVLLARSCTTRRCAILNGVETCAHCSEYRACMYDLKIFNPDPIREDMEARLGKSIPEKDYIAFIKPYRPRAHLDKIRASLKPEEIKDPKMSAVKTKIVDFPDDLHLSKKEISAFKTIHGLLARIASINTGTYAQQVRLKKRREYLLKLLWTFGLFGELKKKGNSYLVIDSKTYGEQKLTGEKRKVDLYLEILKRYGVHCEYMPLTEEEWMTPMGWLRNKGWYMKMSFDNSVGGIAVLKALKKYVTRLDEEYGKSAFRYFKKADMRALKKGGKITCCSI